MKALPHKVSAVTVSEPVDGTVQRRGRGKQRRPSVGLNHIKVDPRVWRKAKAILAEGRYSRIEVIDSETVVVR